MSSERRDGHLSRRAALRFFASAAGMALLAACQAPSPVGPATTTSAPKPTTPPAAPQATAGPTSATSGAAANDRAAQAGFLPVGVGASAASPATPGKGQPRAGGTLRVGNLGDLPNADGHW